MALREALGDHFGLFLGLVAKWLSERRWEAIYQVMGSGVQMPFREAWGCHFGLFWGLVAKWVSERLWGAILACSGLWWSSSFQRGSGKPFWLVLGSGGKIALSEALGGHFCLF